MATYTTIEEKNTSTPANQSQPSTGTSAGQQTSAPAIQLPSYSGQYGNYAYDASSNAAYVSALEALNKAQGNKPTYAGTYESGVMDAYNKIVNREKFAYDPNSDILYQNAREQYVQQGRLAMQDTMGQAAALTGGYGNTYGQQVGQQQYNAYLQRLNEELPQFYGMAADRYDAEGQALQTQYAMLSDQRDTEFGRYQDNLNAYNAELNRLQSEVDRQYDMGYENFYNAQQMGQAAQKETYNRLVSLMTTTGYAPSAEELTAAGMSQAQADAYRNYYISMNTPTSSGGGSWGGGSSKKKETDSGFDVEAAATAALNKYGGNMEDANSSVYKNENIPTDKVVEVMLKVQELAMKK